MITPSQFFDLVRVYCEVLQARITWYNRQPVVEAVQPHPVRHSPHEVWLGVDVIYLPPVPAPADRVEWGRRLGIRVIVEADHDHLQPLEWEAG